MNLCEDLASAASCCWIRGDHNVEGNRMGKHRSRRGKAFLMMEGLESRTLLSAVPGMVNSLKGVHGPVHAARLPDLISGVATQTYSGLQYVEDGFNQMALPESLATFVSSATLANMHV